MSKIKNSTAVKYILSKEVQVSIEDLTDTEILKLNKSGLQITAKKLRLLLLDCRSKHMELEKMLSSTEALKLYIQKIETIK